MRNDLLQRVTGDFLQQVTSYFLQRANYATGNEWILQRVASDFSQRATSTLSNFCKNVTIKFYNK